MNNQNQNLSIIDKILDNIEKCYTITDQDYLKMISNKNSQNIISKNLQKDRIYKIKSFISRNNNSILVSIDNSSSIEVNLNKEKNFIKSLGMNIDDFVESIKNGDDYSIKINTIYPEISGSFFDAYKDVDFKSQLNNANKIYDCKILEKNGGGFFINVMGSKEFLPGSLAAANKIIDFNSYIGKTIKVMVDSYAQETNTYIFSHKKYIDYILASKIEELNFETEYRGTVTGTIDSGIFIEFNNIMTGLLSQNDMNEKTLELFKRKKISPGDIIDDIKIKDIQYKKNIILTQHDITNIIDTLWDYKEKINKSTDNYIIIMAKVVYSKKNVISVQFDNVITSIELAYQKNYKHEIIPLNSTVKLKVTDIIPERNKIFSTILSVNPNNKEYNRNKDDTRQK